MKYKNVISFENPPAIVLGGGGNGLGIVRSLGRRGIFTVVITDDVGHSTMSSRFIGDKISFQGSDAALIDMLLNNSDLHIHKPVLFPIRDATVAVMIKKFEALNEKFRLGMREPNIIKKALCKTSFNAMASEMGFQTAKTYSINNLNELDSIIDKVSFPCILKPELRGNQFLKYASAKAFHAKTPRELIEYYREFSDAAPEAVVQEFIPGKESELYFCFQYYNRNSTPLLSLTGRKIRQWPPKCGSTSSCEVIKNKAIEDLTTMFFKQIDYFGPCSMEMKKNAQTGEFYLIEPTIGRTDWNNSFAEGNGIPIPFIMYCDIVGRPVPNFHPRKMSRKWIRWSADYKAAINQINNGQLSWLGWLKSIFPPTVGPIWSLDDLTPSIFPYLKKIGEKIKRVKRKIWLFERYDIYVEDLSIDIPEIKFDCFFKKASADDIPFIINQFSEHFGENAGSELENRITNGEILIVGYKNKESDSICFLSWLSQKDPFFVALARTKSLQHAICIYRILVPVKYRGQGIGRAGRFFSRSLLRNLGYKTRISFVKDNNIAARKMTERDGAKPQEQLRRIKLFNQQFLRQVTKKNQDKRAKVSN